MNSKDLRQKFLKFFEGKGHKILPSSSLVPSEADPTVLFTTAGMQQLVPYLLGEKHPSGDKLVDVQKCIRTVDIDEVGDKTHNTFFEMLGYWSLGSYWKKEAIELIFEFLTKELNINIKNLAVTCFEGDPKAQIEKDEESAQIWRNLGITKERIAFLGYEDNWWGPAGVEGPCGPDTEIFMWTGANDAPVKFDPSDKNWVEIGNNVFMSLNKNAEGKLEPLVQRNVDFGAGFERVLMTINGVDEIYKTDLFKPLIEKIEELSAKKYSENEKAFRIIADHIRAAVFAIDDNILPSNKDRGYIIRRLIRRAVVKAQQIGISDNFTAKIAEKVFDIYDDIYFNCHSEQSAAVNQESINSDKCKLIIAELEKEENKFRQTLEVGLRILNTYKKIDGKIVFDLYQSYGLPIEVTIEEANNKNIDIAIGIEEEYADLVRAHQELSRTASAGMFKGGLADSGEETTKLHTAAHLLLASLRQVLGKSVEQKGSNITPERLRFDFSYPEKMTEEQIKQVEDMVNEIIKKDLPVSMEEMKLEDAYACGAMGVFSSKYGEKVKVYTIGESPHGGEAISREICGGPHVNHTGELGHFKIIKEESSSSGVRRIKAVLE